MDIAINQDYEVLIQALLEKGFGSTEEWFTEEEINGLREELLLQYNNDNFHLAGIGNKFNVQQETTIRKDQIQWLNKQNAKKYEQIFFQRIDDFVYYLNRTCFAGILAYEFHFSVYEAGAFYKRHTDRFNNDDRRKFSFVLYLNENWQKEHGGELIIYQDGEQLIEPLAGRVVFFSSEIEHEVKKSFSQRLSLTGWLKTAAV